eukprot:scaffold157158_cov22-Tisochrysis_lutea.AAC.2
MASKIGVRMLRSRTMMSCLVLAELWFGGQGGWDTGACTLTARDVHPRARPAPSLHVTCTLVYGLHPRARPAPSCTLVHVTSML